MFSGSQCLPWVPCANTGSITVAQEIEPTAHGGIADSHQLRRFSVLSSEKFLHQRLCCTRLAAPARKSCELAPVIRTNSNLAEPAACV